MNTGYFLNPTNTPIKSDTFKTLKKGGATEVYLRITNSNYNTWEKTLKDIQTAELKPYAWTWQGFCYTKYLADQGWNICLDMETYNMPQYYQEIQEVRTESTGKTFILCTKPQEWDGEQYWSTINKYCDYLMPMLYIGDYNKTITQLESYMNKYNTKYPNKIYPALETYVSDANPVSKSNTTITAEINTVKPYCKGLGLFRYGLSNYTP